MNISELEDSCRQFLIGTMEMDSGHDLAHIERVVANAKKILKSEPANPAIVIVSAWLHDCVILPKNHPARKTASKLAAERAVEFLMRIGFPDHELQAAAHAIEVHSFSAGIEPQTIEAKIVQDADRLDALGAVGIARCLLIGGELGRPLYNPEDPFCENRQPNDLEWTLDHFYTKLFKLPGIMHTKTAKKEAEERVRYMKRFLVKIRTEIKT